MNVDFNIDHFFNISCEVMCVAGTDGVFEAVNPSFENCLGYSKKEILGKNIRELIHPEDLEVTSRKINDCKISSKKGALFLNRFKHKSGAYRWLAWNSFSIHGGHMYGAARDVTDIKAKKDLLRKFEKKSLHHSGLLETVLDSIPNFVCLLDENFQFIFINKTGAQIMGMTQDYFTGKTLEDLGIHYPNIDLYRKEIKEVFLSGQTISNMLTVTVNNKLRDIEYDIMPILNQDAVVGVIYTARDVTEKNIDRKYFEASENKLKKIIDLVPYPIFLKDSSCRYTLINTAQADLFNTTYEYLIGKSDEEFFLNADELTDVVISDRRILEEQVNIVLPEQIITDANGNKIILHTTKIPFFNEIDNSINILGISIDITAVKKSEEELLRTNFELDSFVYKSSHDLRAPLRSLMGLINLAKKEQDVEMRNHILDRSNKSIVKLDTFILELTNFSRNSRVELVVKKINFENIIKECVENLKFMENAQNVQIIMDIQENSDFHSDPGRITILFMNLISNAIKYQNLQISDPFVKVKIIGDVRQATIVISDNGIGIEKEFHKKIFDMFFRASENSFGSGLGLYIVKQVVDKLNGSITLHSEPGKGSEFSISLPSLPHKSQPASKL